MPGRPTWQTSNVTTLASVVAAEESGIDLPMPAWVFGILAFALLVLLLLITLQFNKER